MRMVFAAKKPISPGRLLVCALALVHAACALETQPAPPPPAPPPAAPSAAAIAPAERVDEGGLDEFRAEGVEGAFVVLDVRRGATTVVNPAMASRGYLPASTYKIPNTLIGLSTGVIPDEHFALKWDGVRRKGVAEWNADHDLTSAMRNSVVWFYQEVARRVGPERMQDHLTRFHYGNATMGAAVDQFWLSAGALRISPREQVDFLRRLRAGELPVKAEHAAIVQRVMASEEHEGVTMRWKTGLGAQGDESVGWMVGFVEKGADAHVFASVMTAPLVKGEPSEKVLHARLRAPRRLLGRLGVVPPAMAASTRWK